MLQVHNQNLPSQHNESITEGTLCITSLCLTVVVGCIISITRDNTARKAFQMMATYGITSLPICNTDGSACGVIAASDMLHASNELDLSVIEFVEYSRQRAKNPRAALSIVVCEEIDTLDTALSIMLENEVHHIYVLNIKQVPIGVVSFVDVLRCL